MIVNGTKEFLKRKKASRGLNRILTIFCSFAAAFGIMFLITFIVLKMSVSGLMAENGQETYEHGGRTWVIHQDELPLTIEDLLDIEFDGYIRQMSGDESLLLGQLVMEQRPRFDAEDYVQIPQLEYRIVVVKIPALYTMCKERLIYEKEQLHPIKERVYKSEDISPWGAKEVYRKIAVIVGLIASLLGGIGGSGPEVKLNIDASSANVSFEYAGQTIVSTSEGVNTAFIVGSSVYIALAAIVMAAVYFILGSIVETGYARLWLLTVMR